MKEEISKTAFALCSVLAISACSIVEPSYTIKPAKVATADYQDERLKAEGVMKDLQGLQSKILREKEVYEWGVIAAGLAGAIGAIYGLGEDAIAGAAIGGATSAGVSAYQNPTAIAEIYGNAADAIQCSIKATDKLASWRGEVTSFAGTVSLQSQLTSAAADLENRRSNIATQVNSLIAPPTEQVVEPNEGEEAKPKEDEEAEPRDEGTIAALGYIYSSFGNALSRSQSALMRLTIMLSSDDKNPSLLLHNAVTDIVSKMRNKIIARDRDRSGLEPAAIEKVMKDLDKEKSETASAIENNRAMFNGQVIPVVFALSTISPNWQREAKGLTVSPLDLNDQLGQDDDILSIIANIDTETLDVGKCIKEFDES